jgi:hypothetical protein
VTYIVEGSQYRRVRSACPSLEYLFNQRQLRWGLHPPSSSSGEHARATWIAPSLRLKLTLLGVDVPAMPKLIRAVGRALKSSVWHRVSTSNYP